MSHDPDVQYKKIFNLFSTAMSGIEIQVRRIFNIFCDLKRAMRDDNTYIFV